MGFPSAAALEASAKLAGKLQRGGRIDANDLEAIHRHYHQVPPQALGRYAQQINAQPEGTARRDALITAFGFGADIEQARTFVEQYETQETADLLNAKREEGQPVEQAQPVKPTHVSRQLDDAAERRAMIAARMEPERVSYREARHRVADALDENEFSHKARNFAEWREIERNGGPDRHTADRTRRADVESIYDRVTLHETAEELLDAGDVVEVARDVGVPV